MKYINYKQQDSTAILDIQGIIGSGGMWEEDGIMPSDIEQQLTEIDNSKASNLVLNLDSLGGDLRAGIDIMNLFAKIKIPKVCNIVGWTASSATIVAMAFDGPKDRIRMVQNSLWLVHHAMTTAMGNVFNFETAIQDIKTIDNVILGIYQNKCGSKTFI